MSRPARSDRADRLPPPPVASWAAWAVPLVLVALACLRPSNWLWGFDAVGVLPTGVALALAAVPLAGLLPSVGDAVARALQRLGRAWQARPLAGFACAAALAGAASYAVTDPVRLVGDSSLRLGLLATRLPPERLLPQIFPLDAVVNAGLPRALLVLGMGDESALRLVGALMAAATAGCVFLVLRELDDKGDALAVATLLALASGVFLEFPGYDKFGPLMLGIALAALGAVRLVRGRGGAWLLVAGTAIAILAHRTGYLLLLPAAWLLVRAPGGKRGALRDRVLPGLALVAVAVAVLPRALEVARQFDWKVQRSAAAAASAGALLPRLADALNLTFVYAPWWPWALALGLAARAVAPRAEDPAARGRVGAVALLLVLAPQVGALFALRPPQGAPRDWDMHCGFGMSLMLLTTGVVVQAARAFDLRRAWAPVLGSMLALACAGWWLVGSESAQLERIDRWLSDEPAWNPEQRATALDFLGLRAFNLGRFEESARDFERAIAAEPNPRFHYQAALAWWRAGRLQQARPLALEAAQRSPRIGDPWWVLAAVARAEGDSARTAACLDSARARGSTHPPAGL